MERTNNDVQHLQASKQLHGWPQHGSHMSQAHHWLPFQSQAAVDRVSNVSKD
jgi:hypothetical protein